ncbi:MAG: helix-turn-helix transcriptional regulator [Burkholderiales bacterium]|nr:helix-turn-helix transcriptional regulator [Burkholderiales bacterium]
MPKVNQSAARSTHRDPFLSALGGRVRTLRARNGLTRKALALRAGVSERHLANLESGQGNASVMLLRQLALALRTSIGELVGESGAAADPARTGRIALIGLRGAGKSTLGRMLADDLRVPFVELDREVERVAGCDVGEIHSLYGPAAFRRYELRALEATVETHPRAVVAAGGGIVTEGTSYHLLRARCYTVWLRATPDEHMKRVVAQGDLRPMAGHAEAMDDLKRILASREADYAKADFAFDTGGKPLAEAYLALREGLQSRMHYAT